MDKLRNEKLKEIIVQLGESDAGRSATARLADIIDEVEQAMKKGAKRQAIIEQLKAAGLHFTIGSFKNARRRIRERNARSPKRAQKVTKAQEKPAAAPPVAAEASKTQTSSEAGPKKFVHNSNPNLDDLF